jgi:hypothetical protein
MQDEASYPFGDTVWQYRKAGWTGAQPVGRRPAEKAPPFKGFTGWTGVDPSGADVQSWLDEGRGALNIGLHLPAGVFVLDQDVYGEKTGDVALKALQATLSPLPRTWTSTARGATSGSRQFFYRATLPPGRVWMDHPVPAVDALHVGHRYAVVWPSVHPLGMTYHWYDPDGELYEGVPALEELAELPADHVLAYSKEGQPLEGSGSSYEEATAVIEKMRHAPACPRVTRTLREELDRINSAASESLHAPGPLYKLVSYGLEGHAGVREALSEHQAAYVSARVAHRGDAAGSAGADWWRQVCGAVGKKLVANGGEVRGTCGCSSIPDTSSSSSSTPDTSSSSSSTPDTSSSRVLEGSVFAAPSDHLFDGPPIPPRTEVIAAQTPSDTPLDAVQALLGEMLSFDQMCEQPAPRYLIKTLLNLDSECWIIGEPGCRKSFVTLDMCAHVALGKDWQGLKVTQGVVVMIVAEGAGGMSTRVKAWRQEYGHVPGNMLYVLPRPVQAADKAAWKVLTDVCVRVGAALVVVDTQARVTVGLEENSATEMGHYIDAVTSIRQATAGCVLTVHHTGRNGGDARGSSAIDGAQGTELKVLKGAGLTGTLRVEKQKDMQEAGDLQLTFRVVTVGVDEDGDNITSLVLAPARTGFDLAEGQEAEVEQVVRIAEPQKWTYDVTTPAAKIQRRILQVMAQIAATDLGRSEDKIKRTVAEAWYGGKVSTTEGALSNTKWNATWPAVAALPLPEGVGIPGDTIVIRANGANWRLHPDFVDHYSLSDLE